MTLIPIGVDTVPSMAVRRAPILIWLSPIRLWLIRDGMASTNAAIKALTRTSDMHGRGYGIGLLGPLHPSCNKAGYRGPLEAAGTSSESHRRWN